MTFDIAGTFAYAASGWKIIIVDFQVIGETDNYHTHMIIYSHIYEAAGTARHVISVITHKLFFMQISMAMRITRVNYVLMAFRY